MKILIYGAGVIGSIYAVKFANAGYNVTLLARGDRLKILKERGLLYKEHDRIKMARVKILEQLRDDDRYDFIFLPVQTKQAEQALKQISENCSPTIVTMVNTIDEGTASCLL